jgi:hypothetical protein
MKLKSTPEQSPLEIVEYINRTISTLRADKAWLDFNIGILIHDKTGYERSRIDWDLVHFQSSWLETIRNLERLQAAVTKGTNAS